MSIRRQLKNVVNNYSNAEVKVREATSNDPWGPSSSVMTEIADATYNVVAFSEIMGMIWKRLNDHGKNWRHVYKSLVVLDYIIKTGSERVAQQCRENLYAVQTLKDFQFIDKDGKDQGMNVREKAKQLVVLLKDEDRLKSERARALKAKERFAQASSGIGSDSLRAGKLRDSGSTSDIHSESTASASAVPTSRSWEPERKVMGSDVENCRPSNANEEELQLQLALALSKQEAEEKERMQDREDQRLQMAISQSQKMSTPPEPSLLDLAGTGPSLPPQDNTYDPWGNSSTPQVQAPMAMPQPDPWGSGLTTNVSATADPWASGPSTTAPPTVSSTQQVSLFGAPNGMGPVGPSAGSTDPWGAPPAQSAPVVPQPSVDPWGGSTFSSDSQAPWGPAPDEGFSAFGQTSSDISLSSQPALQPSPFDMPSESESSVSKTSEGHVDSRLTNLVNLDSLVSKPDPVTNPFLSSQPVVPTSKNPFMQDKPQAPTLNQLRQAPVLVQGSSVAVGGDILLPAPLIPDSGTGPQQTVQSNPFL